MTEDTAVLHIVKTPNFLVRNARPLAITTAVVAVAALAAYKLKYGAPVENIVTELPV